MLDCLAVLADSASGHRIHELSGVKTLRTTQCVLARLTEIGLVDIRPVGLANQYSLDRAHILWEPIKTLLATPARLDEQISHILSKTFTMHIAGAALYGPSARGAATNGSNIDILIVWAMNDAVTGRVELIDKSSEQIRRLTGNPVQVLPITQAELSDLTLADDPLIESLRANARWLMGGFDFNQLIRPA
ncbi:MULTISPECIES: nucleotidyltransferase domain-containing protein [unclassified Cryobacterium]|uniref:nucleotidyltransferase domain-containing protein n=1 Tax=unclassified Cryobacterium TaxID=2649013 RepID=UPI002AB48F10|nr:MULTISPECIES: nucleotidyltransferase domain-containing protein [unclassified Cryobacterium]MDY7540806.1 nucleotidyltransferase domain-containing protein [Cryobacterium sp. 5B3]MEB0000958.1 nucleotidyltransferase domain-containing protein [Cryobacterium sp. RTS3]MEB0266116.1 nucleotidyltransferase domain-containing protein [Cryobacterium sp. 10I5]MEB0276656.1 nucleotidyltransferase domain-containing protein [Cryobacterium sp. 5B3]